ncbi:MAG: alpha/beta hydrolase, partial [Actinomycetota bacterium]|nr:alpha/beta hydrolase [Actinomycetota bacterium]
KKTGLVALAGAAVGVGAGLVAQRSMVRRRRRDDPEAAAPFGQRRGVRAQTIELPDGARLFIEEAGPPSSRGAVFLHGSALRTDVWHYQLDGIGAHRLVFYDLRGHGLSQPKGDATYSIPTLADDLERVLDAVGLEEAVLVGHSVGGMVALQYCSDHLDQLSTRIKGLVLVNTTHRPALETITGGAAVARIERAVRHPLDLLGSQHRSIDRLRKIIRPSDSLFLAVSFSAFGPQASARQVDFTYDMLAETPTDVIFDLFKCYRDFDIGDVLGDISVPALVVAGTHDRLTVSGASQYLDEHLPKAELELIEGCGHMTMLERHARFNTMLERFFDDTLGTGAEG